MNATQIKAEDERSLDGKQVLFVGDMAARGGNRIIDRLLAAGADVLAVASNSDELRALADQARAAQGRLTTLTADLTTPDGADAIRRHVLALGRPLTAAVVNAGGPHLGPSLADAGAGDLDAASAGLKVHLLLAKTLLPLLKGRHDTLYLVVSDGAALDPKPLAGITAATAAGQLMLTRTLSLETGGTPIVHGLVVSAAVPGQARDLDRLTPDNIGEAVVQLVASPAVGRDEVVLGAGWRECLALRTASDQAVTYL